MRPCDGLPFFRRIFDLAMIFEGYTRYFTYLVLPGREKEARHFIQKAIEISNDYELDIEIEEHLSHISATYYFDCGACMGFLKRIIEMSDDISFFDHIKGFDMVMSLDFYTKAVFKRDRLIQPQWLDLSR